MRATREAETGGGKTRVVLYETKVQIEQRQIKFRMLCRWKSRRRRPRLMFPHIRGRPCRRVVNRRSAPQLIDLARPQTPCTLADFDEVD
jgi:hypothetical protein